MVGDPRKQMQRKRGLGEDSIKSRPRDGGLPAQASDTGELKEGGGNGRKELCDTCMRNSELQLSHTHIKSLLNTSDSSQLQPCFYFIMK